MKSPRLLILCSLALAAAAVRADPVPPRAAPAPAPIPQWTGQYGGSPSFATRVIRGAGAWAAFWTQSGKGMPRSLDESREMAVVVGIGERPTGGYTVAITGAEVRKGTLVVTYAESAPGPGRFVTEALTNPWVIAILPLSDLPVSFQAEPAPAPPPPVGLR